MASPDNSQSEARASEEEAPALDNASLPPTVRIGKALEDTNKALALYELAACTERIIAETRAKWTKATESTQAQILQELEGLHHDATAVFNILVSDGSPEPELLAIDTRISNIQLCLDC